MVAIAALVQRAERDADQRDHRGEPAKPGFASHGAVVQDHHDAAEAEHEAAPLHRRHPFAEPAVGDGRGQDRLQAGNECGQPCRNRMRDRDRGAAKIEAMDKYAGDRAVREARAIRPFRPRNRRDDRHQADHDRHADGEISQGIGIVDDVFGADESGAPEHDEQDRCRAGGQGFLIMVHRRPHCPTRGDAAMRISPGECCDATVRWRLASAAHHSSGQGSMIFQSSTPFLIFFMSVVSPPLRRIQSFTVSG